jgi:hypothetical protein
MQLNTNSGIICSLHLGRPLSCTIRPTSAKLFVESRRSRFRPSVLLLVDPNSHLTTQPHHRLMLNSQHLCLTELMMVNYSCLPFRSDLLSIGPGCTLSLSTKLSIPTNFFHLRYHFTSTKHLEDNMTTRFSYYRSQTINDISFANLLDIVICCVPVYTYS